MLKLPTLGAIPVLQGSYKAKLRKFQSSLSSERSTPAPLNCILHTPPCGLFYFTCSFKTPTGASSTCRPAEDGHRGVSFHRATCFEGFFIPIREFFFYLSLSGGLRAGISLLLVCKVSLWQSSVKSTTEIKLNWIKFCLKNKAFFRLSVLVMACLWWKYEICLR